jgi:DNA-binding transcriptional regulator YdaS (Cro superfamily)
MLLSWGMTEVSPIAAAITLAGSEAKLAALIGCSQPAINKLRKAGRVSAEMAVKIEAAVGISRTLFRPDLWPPGMPGGSEVHSLSSGAVPPAPTAAASEPVSRPDAAAFSSKEAP